MMISTRVTAAALAASLFGILASFVQAVTLTENGKPAATIVVRYAALEATAHPLKPGAPVNADQKVNLAAHDLQTYIEKISGATLPIVGDDHPVAGPRVLVGRSKPADAMGVKIPEGFTRERREEGFVILAKGDTLLLAGNEAHPYNGTHYAVAELLHRLGVRWYMPGDFGEIVPKLPTITVADVEAHGAPDFPLRTYFSHLNAEMIHMEYLWKLRNRIQPDVWSMIEVAGDSYLNKYMPDKTLIETRPELFAKTVTGRPNPVLPNLTHPDAVQIVAGKMKDALRARAEKPDAITDWLGFSPNDGAPVDFTEATMKLNMRFPNSNGRDGEPNELCTSEEWFTFANAVAAEVATEFPDAILTTTGYANRDLAPISVKLHPNLSVMYAAIWADNLKALNNPRSWHSAMRGATLRRWTELSRFVYTYDYFEMLVSSLTPTPVLRRHAADFPLFKQWGLFGFFHERRAAAAMEYGIAPRYFMVRLMWNADLDIDAGLHEFYDRWYGPAAQPARVFWDALEETMEQTPLLGHEDRILPYVYTVELMEQLDNACAKAEAMAEREPFTTHVKLDRHILEHLRAYRAMHEAEFECDFAGAMQAADDMFEHREALHAISPFLHMPERLDRTDGGGRNSGVWYWTLNDRRQFYAKLNDRINGTSGTLVALAPRRAAFTLDPGDRGRILRWFLPEHDQTGWQTVDTTSPYYLQVEGGLDKTSMPYAGAMWYAFEVDVPKTAAGQTLRFCVPTIVPQAWIWVNGAYAGRREYKETYIRPASVDLDISPFVNPGARNLIVTLVKTGANRTQAPEGFLGRAFLYTPTPASP